MMMRFILSEFDSFFYLQKRKTGTWTSSLFFRAIIVVGGKREKKEIHTHHLQIKGAFFRVTHTLRSRFFPEVVALFLFTQRINCIFGEEKTTVVAEGGEARRKRRILL